MDGSPTLTQDAALTTIPPRPAICDTILDTIGWTPLVRLHRVTQGVAADVLAKVEFFNPGGSVKDRIGLKIIEDAERSGRLKPGGTIVEATSGNTGVGLAIAAAIKGYKCIFVMPDKMSQEKISLLRSFGARVVITPTAVTPEDPRSYYMVSKRLVEETPNAILANQYHNPVNPLAHYESTGPELWAQTGGKLDMVVIGMGTGGTISGIARYLKERNPAIKIVGVDPIGSLLYDTWRLGRMPEEPFLKTYKTEGIGEDFIPSTLDLALVDEVVQVTDRETFLMTRRLVREEGIFCGGSCGSAMAGALKVVRDLSADKVVVVIFPDSGSRYLSKVFDDNWMRDNGFLEETWMETRASDLLGARRVNGVVTAKPSDLISNVVALMKQHDISQMPVVDAQGTLCGIVTEIDILSHMIHGTHTHQSQETIEPIIHREVITVRPDTPLEALVGIFTSGNIAIVTEHGRVTGIITKIDVIDFLATHAK